MTDTKRRESLAAAGSTGFRGAAAMNPGQVRLLHVCAARPNFMKIAPLMAAVDAWNNLSSEHDRPRLRLRHSCTLTSTMMRASVRSSSSSLGCPSQTTILVSVQARTRPRPHRYWSGWSLYS